jgi:hypothetical protein
MLLRCLKIGTCTPIVRCKFISRYAEAVELIKSRGSSYHVYGRKPELEKDN